MTSDQRLYWLIYSVVASDEPMNAVVVLDSAGAVVAEDQFPESRSFQFTSHGRAYTIQVPKAEMPG